MNRDQKNNRILIVAGGTGGHVYPALAVAEKLREQKFEIAWLGMPNGFEAAVTTKNNILLLPVHSMRWRGQGVRSWLKMPWVLFLSIWQSLQHIRRFKPALVVGFGGFVAGPAGIAAWLLRVPLVIHEQNAIPGLTNRWLAKIARRVCEAYSGSFPTDNHVVATGNPLRNQLATMSSREYSRGLSHPLHLLVVGGSLGAKIFNQVVPEAMILLDGHQPLVWHQTGQAAAMEVMTTYQRQAISAKVMPFIDNMAEAYTWAAIVLCRAGAMTVTEMAAIGMPSILVPLPQAADNHQYYNALSLTKHKAAVLCLQSEFTPAWLAGTLQRLSADQNELNQMALAAKQQFIADATDKVVKVCLDVYQATVGAGLKPAPTKP